jgi:hypothetical protein
MNALLTRTLWDAYAEEAEDLGSGPFEGADVPPDTFDSFDPLAARHGLTGRAAEQRTYVGLRRPHGWQLLVITSAATTVLWDGAPMRGRLQLVTDEASGIANALLEDLAQCRPPIRARAALARRIGAELQSTTFVFQGRELGAWVLEQRLYPRGWKG